MNRNAYPNPNGGILSVESRVMIVLLILAAIAVWVVVSIWQHRHTPEDALEQIQAVKTEADIEAHENYLTARGKKIFAIAISAANDVGMHPAFGKPTVDGDAVVVPFTDPKAEGRLEFKKDGVWQLDNIVLTTMKGRRYYADFSSVAEPLYAFGKAFGDKSPGQIMADERYLTDKGKKVCLRLLEQRKEHHGSDDDVVFDEPYIRGHTAYFTVYANSGQNEARFEVVKEYDGWKFDDLTIVKVDGSTKNQSVAEIIDSPLWVWFKSALW